MKAWISLILVTTLHTMATAQDSDKIEVSYDKSSILVFDAPIKPRGWNCGLKELVGVSVMENKILLQSKEEHFEETNLIVELTDGSMYAFDLVYNNNPKKTFHVIKNASAVYRPESSSPSEPGSERTTVNTKVQGTRGTENSKIAEGGKEKGEKGKEKMAKGGKAEQAKREKNQESDALGDVETVASQVAASSDYLKRIGLISKKMFLFIGGIYSFGDKMYFKVNVKNVSSVPYDIDYAQFLVKSRKNGVSRTSSTGAEELEPVFIARPDVETINKDQTVTFVYVFEKFTISDEKKLHLEVWEKNGDRSLELPIESIEILNAKNSI